MKKKDIFAFILMLSLSLVMCLGFVSGHYSTDDFNIMNIGYNKYSLFFNLREGRPIMYLVDQLFLRLNISYDVFIKTAVISAIVLTCITIILLYHLIEKYSTKKKSMLYIILFTMIFNFMYIENLYFVESIVMALSLLLYTLSAKYFFKEGIKNILLSVFLTILATLSYNGLECYFIIIIAFISLLKNKRINKSVIFDILKAGIMIIASVAINLLQVKITCYFLKVPDVRAIRFKPFYNMLYIIYNLPVVLLETSKLFPKYLFMGSLILLLILSIIYDIKKHKEKLFLENIFLTIISIFSCFCVSIVSLSSFGSGRLLFGIGMTIGLLLLNSYLEVKDKSFKRVLIVLSIIWLLLNSFNYFNRTLLSKHYNKVEENEIIELNKEIKEYELENDIEVTKMICVTYDGIKDVSAIDSKALKTGWSCNGVVNFYTGRELKKKELTKKEMKKYHEKIKDKDYLLEDDTLIIEMYDW